MFTTYSDRFNSYLAGQISRFDLIGSNLMKLSTRARYALRLMIEIARESSGEPISLNHVANTTHISRRYLEQLVIGLKKAVLLRGVAGRSGGYFLARPAKDIRIGEIIEAAIGPVNIVHCVLEPESCGISEICECRVIYQLINKRITEVLNEFSLAELADKNWLRKTRMEFCRI